MLYIVKIVLLLLLRLFIEYMIYRSIMLWNYDIFINVNVLLENVSCVLDVA